MTLPPQFLFKKSSPVPRFRNQQAEEIWPIEIMMRCGCLLLPLRFIHVAMTKETILVLGHFGLNCDMLQQLSIRNYAIIDSIDIKFPGGMNVITGETGAGKSIIMGALGLILGDRSDSSALLSKVKKCIVEGVFKADHRQAIKNFLKEHDPDNYHCC